MARAIVDLRQAERRQLPAVCVVSGREADGIQPVRFTYSTASGAWILLGFWAFLAANSAGQRELLIPLPFREDAWLKLRHRWRTLTGYGIGIGTCGAAIALVGPAMAGPDALLVGLVALVAGVVLLLYARSRPGLPTLDGVTTDGYAELSGVHDAFAEALERT